MERPRKLCEMPGTRCPHTAITQRRMQRAKRTRSYQLCSMHAEVVDRQRGWR